jgi:hypothetical protein
MVAETESLVAVAANINMVRTSQQHINEQLYSLLIILIDHTHEVSNIVEADADRRGSAECWTFRSAPNVPTAQRTDSNKLLVTADRPLAQ